MTLDLHTLEKIRAEVEERAAKYKTRKRMTPFQDTLFNYASNVLTDLLHYLDTEITNAKNHD